MAIIGWRKPDAYVITLLENDIDLLFNKLIRSNYWNPRAKFVIIYEGNVSKIMESLFKIYVLNVLVLVRVPAVEIDIYTYYPYKSHLQSGKTLYLLKRIE